MFDKVTIYKTWEFRFVLTTDVGNYLYTLSCSAH